MTSFVPDTNVMIASVQAWHVHHERARSELRTRRENGDALLLAAHSLVECYSVLTRLPPSQRVRPEIAVRMIGANFVERGRIIGLGAGDYWPILEAAAGRGVAGGRVFDALIAAAARAAGAEVLLTFNVRHFVGLTEGLEIVEPGAS
ncbi:MAG: PIN domain-containing protein [Dehalococcoidia bacterium]